MTPQEKRQAVEARIREVVPSLQKLSFGCEYEYAGSRYKYVSSYEWVTTSLDGIYLRHTSDSMFRERVEHGHYKLIGHPIRLNNVLDAIEQVENGQDNKEYVHLEMYSNGEMRWIDFDGDIHNSCAWDMVWSDLSHASDDVIEFLHEVLISKE